MSDNVRILKVNSSSRYADSSSRRLTDAVVASLLERHPGAEVIERDLAQGIPFVSETSIAAAYTPPAERTQAQEGVLSTSDHLVRELLTADYLVLGAPMYNFSVPAAMKAYFDQLARVGLTFSYSEQGPLGLVDNIRAAYAVITSNGVPLGAPADYSTGYIQHFLGFLGIHDVRIVDATGQIAGPHRETEALVGLDLVAA